MILLSLEGHSVANNAWVTRQSDDTVRRWLLRFGEQGWQGLLEGVHLGRLTEIASTIENFRLM